MDKIKRNTIVVGVTLLPKHKDYIEHLMAEKAFMSASDVHRRAIEFLHEKTFPDYIFNKSATDLKKREELTEKQKMDAMTDKEYVEAFVKDARIFPGTDGKDFVVIHWFGNSVGAIPLEGAKQWFSENMDFLDNHNSLALTKDMDKELSYAYTKGMLKKNYGIILADAKKEKSNK